MKKDTKTIIILLLICLALTFVIMPFRIKAESFGTYIINTNVPLSFSCQNSTYLNISRVYIYPNGTNIINQETATTKAGNVYNYTIASSSISNIGTYVVNYHCDTNGLDTPAPASFFVDNSGYSLSTGDSILLIMAFLAILILAIIFFAYGIHHKVQAIKIFCLAMSVLFVVFAFGFGFNIFNQILGKYPAMSSSLSGIYTLLTVLLIVGGVGIVVWLIAFAMNSWWKYRGFRD